MTATPFIGQTVTVTIPVEGNPREMSVEGDIVRMSRTLIFVELVGGGQRKFRMAPETEMGTTDIHLESTTNRGRRAYMIRKVI